MNRRYNINWGLSRGQQVRSRAPGNALGSTRTLPVTNLRARLHSSPDRVEAGLEQSSEDRFAGDPADWVPSIRPHARIPRENVAQHVVPSQTTPPKSSVPDAPTGLRHSHPHTYADRLKSAIPINGTATAATGSTPLTPPLSPGFDHGHNPQANNGRRQRKRGRRGGKSKRNQAAIATHRPGPANSPPKLVHRQEPVANMSQYHTPPGSREFSGESSRASSDHTQAMDPEAAAPWRRYYQFLADRPAKLSDSVMIVVPGRSGQPVFFTPTEYQELLFYDGRRASYEVFRKLELVWHRNYSICMEAGASDAEACFSAWQMYLDHVVNGEAAEIVKRNKDFSGMWVGQWQLALRMMRRARRNDGSHNPSYASYWVANDLDISGGEEVGETREDSEDMIVLNEDGGDEGDKEDGAH